MLEIMEEFRKAEPELIEKFTKQSHLMGQTEKKPQKMKRMTAMNGMAMEYLQIS